MIEAVTVVELVPFWLLEKKNARRVRKDVCICLIRCAMSNDIVFFPEPGRSEYPRSDKLFANLANSEPRWGALKKINPSMQSGEYIHKDLSAAPMQGKTKLAHLLMRHGAAIRYVANRCDGADAIRLLFAHGMGVNPVHRDYGTVRHALMAVEDVDLSCFESIDIIIKHLVNPNKPKSTRAEESALNRIIVSGL